MIEFKNESYPDCFFEGLTPPPELLIELQTHPLGLPPYAPSPAPTMEWNLKIIVTATANFHSGQVSARLPVAVDAPSAFVMVPNVGPDQIPNSVIATPRPWDAVD